VSTARPADGDAVDCTADRDPVDRNADRTAVGAEHDALAHALVAVLAADLGVPRAGERLVVGIAGESGSGKSVTATGLARALTTAGAATGVVHQDDYFLRPPRANHARRLRDLASVGPQEVDLARIERHVADFRAGRDGVLAPVVDYPGDRFLARRRDFSQLAVLVVEGTYALRLADLDVRVFLAATHAETAERRRLRARDPHEPIVDRVLGIEHALVAPQRARAHVVIDRDFRIVERPARRAAP
jgi:uridine kinase